MGVVEKMNKGTVICFLRLFPEMDNEIKIRKNAIEYLEQYYNPISGVSYSNISKGKYAKSNQTEQVALNIPDYVQKDVQKYKTEIEELQKVRCEIIKEVSQLKLKQKNVIFGFYFYGMKWERIAKQINYSDRQCKNIRDGALEELLQNFSKNEVLIKYQMKRDMS